MPAIRKPSEVSNRAAVMKLTMFQKFCEISYRPKSHALAVHRGKLTKTPKKLLLMRMV